MTEHAPDDPIAAVAAIHDPMRRRLYRLLLASDHPLSRDDAATELGVTRSTAAFHLDRLADAGLADVGYERRTGRTGPGAGRPAKLYRATGAELVATVPSRRYELAGDLLASAIETSERDGVPIRDAVEHQAAARGREAGARTTSLAEFLADGGYEPLPEHDTITFGNCPFHRLAAAHTDLVCRANVSYVEGALDALGDSGYAACFEPGAGGCCVRLVPAVAAVPRGQSGDSQRTRRQ